MNSIDLSPEVLERIKALAQKATPGPWQAEENSYACEQLEIYMYITNIFGGSVVNIIDERPGMEADAAYIAAAHPGVVLAMCKEIERLREQVATQEVLSGDACMTQLEVERGALEEQVTRLTSENERLARMSKGCPPIPPEYLPDCDNNEEKYDCVSCRLNAVRKVEGWVEKIERLEKEADWLAHCIPDCPDEYDPDGPWNVCKGKDCAGPGEDQGACWRRTARKAVEGAA